jgi:acyl-coenzyme A thioesterase PaaI-like protein
MTVMNKSHDNLPPISTPDGFVDFEVSEGFAKHIGPLCWKLSSNSAEFGFRVMDHHLNPGKICHGGVMMTVADMAIGFAVTWELKLLSFAPSINNYYDFVGAGEAGDWLETKTEVVQTTKRMGFARGVLYGSNGPVMRYNGIVKIPSDTDPRFNSNPFAERMQQLFDRHK